MNVPTTDISPVYMLSTKKCESPIAFDDALTPTRLDELRGALAVLAAAPITTLEVHPKPADIDVSRGIPLGSLSPLARELATLAADSSKVVASAASSSGETLYRMVVPAKVAAQVSGGVMRHMPSKAVAGGVHSAIVGAKGVGAHATFVPVAKGAVGGSAATAGVAVAGAGALTVAAPLILLTLAAGASAYADNQRQAAIDRIEALLTKANQERLDDERNRLDGCRSAIDKATGILLDKGKIGMALGLDSAVNVIDTAIAAAERRTTKWRDALATLPSDKVELPALTAAFDGIDDPNSEFYAHMELADLAVSLKRRVIVLQAVEHAQLDEGNLFENFTDALKLDAQNLDMLVANLDDIRLRLSTLQLDRSHGFRDFTFSSGSVDKLLGTAQRLRSMGDRVAVHGRQSDVAIEMVQAKDGSLVVLPPVAVA
jgi:hypothetical protein